MLFFFSSRRRHTRCLSDWSSDVCSSDLKQITAVQNPAGTALNFVSTIPGFQISLGTTTDNTGLGTALQQGTTLTALQVGTGGTADISTMAGAQAAVTAIT